MYNVSVIGQPRTGKSSLCSQWCGEPFSDSYCSTIFVDMYHPTVSITLHEIPTDCREPVDPFYEHTDVFVLVVREDASHHDGYEYLSRLNKNASWIMILNGPQTFAKSRLYAKNRGMAMAHVNLKSGEGVTESLKILEEITQLHQQRPTPVSLLGEVYQWIPACV